MEEYFVKDIPELNGTFLCTRNIQVGDTLKECFPDRIERKVHHFETILPDGVWVFEPYPTENEVWIHAYLAFKVIGQILNLKWEIPDGFIVYEDDWEVWVKAGIVSEPHNKNLVNQRYSFDLAGAYIKLKCPTCGTFH